MARNPPSEIVVTGEQVGDHVVTLRPLTDEEIERSLSAASELGMLSERVRVQIILESDEARKHPTAAQALALASDMDPEAALGLLGSLPPESGRATGGGQFAEVLADCERRKQAEEAAKSAQGEGRANNQEGH